jgi:hypothetical protein
MTVQSTAKLLHARRSASILLKVDIVKAFDAISWAFLLEPLSYIGCSRCWVNWISALLSTASSDFKTDKTGLIFTVCDKTSSVQF